VGSAGVPDYRLVFWPDRPLRSVDTKKWTLWEGEAVVFNDFVRLRREENALLNAETRNVIRE